MRLCLLAVALLQAVTATNRTFCFSYVECFERAQKELKECSGGTAWALTLESRDKTIADLIKGRQALISTCQDHLVKEVVDFDTLQVLVNEDARECFTKLPATSRKYDYNNLNCKYEAETKDRDHYGKDPYQCALEFISDRHTCEKLLDCCSDHSRCAERMNAVSMAYQHAKLKSNQIVSNVLTCVVSNDPTSGELVNRLQGQRPSLRYPGLPFFTPDLVTEERVNRRLALTSHAALDRRRQRFNRRYHQVRSLFTQQWESLFRTEQRRTGLTIPAARRISIVKNLLKNAKEEELAQYVTLIADGNFVRLAELERQKVGRLQNEEQVDEAMDKMKKIRDAIKAALEVKEKKNPKRAVAAAHNVQEIPRPEFETVPVPSVEDVVMKAMAEVDSETLNRAKKFANAAGKALQERKKNIQARSSFSIDGIPDTRTAEMNHNLDGAPVHEFSTLNQRNMKPPQTIGGSMQPLSESRMVSMARAATTHSAANKNETEDTKESEALTPVVTEDEPAKKIKLDKAKNEEKVDASSNKSEETIKNSENSDETDEDSDAEVKKVEKEEEKEVEEKEPKKETETKEKSDSTDEKEKENDEEEEKDNKKKEKEKKEKEDENEEKKVKEGKEDVNDDNATEEAKKDKQVVEEDLEKEEKPKKEKKVKKEEKPDDKDSVTEKPKEDEDTSANGAEEQEEESTTAKKEDKKEESAKPAKKEKKHKRTKKTAKSETDEENEESKSETEESSKKETSVKETSEEPTETKDSESEDSGKETKKNDSNKKSTDIEKEGEKTETVPSEKEGEKEEENEEKEGKKEKEEIDEDDKKESPKTKESDEKKEEKPKKSKKSQENEAKKSATESDDKAEVKEEKKSKKSKTEEKEEESEPKTDEKEEVEKDTEGTDKTDEVATVVEEADDEEEKVASKDDKMSKLSEELKMTSDALKRSIDDEFEDKPSKGSRIGGLAGEKKHHKERIVESKDTEDEETEKKEKVITPAAKALMKKIISEMKKTVKEEKKTEKEDTSDSLESASESMESEESSSMAQSEEKEETSTKQAENSDEDTQASEEQHAEKTVAVKLEAKVVHDGESKGSRHCRVFANCEETVRDYEEQCHRRYSPDILAHGIEDAEILSILVNSSSTNHEIVMKACLRPLDKALHSTLRQLFIIQRGVRKACLSLGRNKKDMDDHEKAMCSTEIPSTAAIDEFLAAHQLRSEEAFYTCQALLSPVRDSCNAIQPCCASIPPCDRFIANSEVRKMRDEAVSRLVKKQNACETRMLDTLRALRAEIGPNGELIRRRRFL